MYYAGDTSYSSFIYALNRETADKIIKARNIGEKIVGQLVKTKGFNPSPLSSDFYLERDLMNCVHSLTFYGWLGCRAGVTCGDKLMRDDGILHEVLHEMHFPKDYQFRQHIYEKILELEEAIPGLTSYTERPLSKRGPDRRELKLEDIYDKILEIESAIPGLISHIEQPQFIRGKDRRVSASTENREDFVKRGLDRRLSNSKT